MKNKYFLHLLIGLFFALSFLGCGKDKPDKPEKKLDSGHIQYVVEQPLATDFHSGDSVLDHVGNLVQQGKVVQIHASDLPGPEERFSGFNKHNLISSYCFSVPLEALSQVYEELTAVHQGSLKASQLVVVENCEFTQDAP